MDTIEAKDAINTLNDYLDYLNELQASDLVAGQPGEVNNKLSDAFEAIDKLALEIVNLEKQGF